MDLRASEKSEIEGSHVSKSRRWLRSVLLCGALGVSGCATSSAVGPLLSENGDFAGKLSEKKDSGADARNTTEKRKGGSKSNETGELEERMKAKCEEEGYLSPIDCNLDTDPSDPDRAKVKFRALFI